MSLRFQMAGLIGVLLIVVIGATGLGLYWAERHSLIQKMEEARGTQLTQFAQSLRDALVMHDDLAAMNAANALIKIPGVMDAYGVSSTGIIVAHGMATKVGQREWGTKGIRLAQKIGLGKGTIDAVLVFSPSFLREETDRALHPVARRIAGVSLLALMVGLAGAVAVAGRLIRPVQRIVEGTRRIASGDLSYRLALGPGNEINRLADEFDHMAKRLGEADQMKKDFVSNVTHELRSPLSAIESYLNLVTDTVREGDYSSTLDHLAIMRNNATRLGRFIDNVLDLSKIEARGIDLRMEFLDLANLLNEVAKLFLPKAREKFIDMKVVVPKDTVLLWADADKMQQILINLIGNALKFTPAHGKITLSAQREDRHVIINVSDTGPGIPPADLGRIFDRFQQAKNANVPSGTPKGTGLGLAIARGLVEAQGGTISVESIVGRGTLFTVRFQEKT